MIRYFYFVSVVLAKINVLSLNFVHRLIVLTTYVERILRVRHGKVLTKFTQLFAATEKKFLITIFS